MTDEQEYISKPIRGILKYIAKGVESSREQRKDLEVELNNLMQSPSVVTILPVVQGLSIEIELDDISPFNEHSLEPYLTEHVLPEAIGIICNTTPPALQLIKTHFS